MRKSLLCCLLLPLGTVALPGRAADDKIEPTNITSVNTDADEDEPHVADAGRTLYYGITKNGKELVNVATRRTASGPWGKPSPIETYVTNKGDVRGVYSTAGRYPLFLFFAAKDRQGKNYDLFVAVKDDVGKAWTAARPVGGDQVNTAQDEAHPWLSNDGKALYFSRRTKDGWKVFVSKRKNATGPQGWEEAAEVGIAAGYHHATLTPDGKTMYLQGPLEKDRWGLFVSTHDGKAWGKAEALEGLNNAEGKTGDRSPSLSRDGKFLYFASDRPGGKGGLDLYWIETAKLAKK